MSRTTYEAFERYAASRGYLAAEQAWNGRSYIAQPADPASGSPAALRAGFHICRRNTQEPSQMTPEELAEADR